MSAPLLTSVKVGDLTLKNRVVMAAMTRTRADPKTGIPTALHAEYYSQRANAGLILTECAQISPDSLAFPGSAGIHSEEQVAGWKTVTDAVHKAGSYIFLQIWHGGRAVPKEFSGQDPVAPSPVAIKGKYRNATGEAEHTAPRELTVDEIKAMVANFRKGAENAKAAGFDGVELHAANGYIVHQFLSSGSNQRTDEYGGSVENRCRFALEVLDQLIEVFGKDRVGAKVSPVERYNDMYDANPLETYQHLLTEFNNRGIAFVEFREANDVNMNDHPKPKDQMAEVTKTLKPFFKGTIIYNQGVNFETGNKIISEGLADACSIGTLFIANPDLVKRFENGWPTVPSPNWATVFGNTEDGYTSYPVYTEPKKEAQPEKPKEAEPEKPKEAEKPKEEEHKAQPAPEAEKPKAAEPEKAPAPEAEKAQPVEIIPQTNGAEKPNEPEGEKAKPAENGEKPVDVVRPTPEAGRSGCCTIM